MQIMEITAGQIGQFDIAKLIMKPSLRTGDMLDIEILFLSKKSPGVVKGYVTIDNKRECLIRSYGGSHSPISNSAKVSLRAAMKQLAIQLFGENNV